MKKKLIVLFLSLAMMLALVSCGSSGTTSGQGGSGQASSSGAGSSAASSEGATPVSSDPTHGGSATFYYPKFYNYFDAAAKNQLGYQLWQDCLFSIDWGLNDPSVCDFTGTNLTYDQVTGQAAESYEVAEDYSYIDITLRDNIYFQQKEGEYDIFGGRQFTAADAVYTFSRLLGLNGVTKVECETDWATELYMVQSVEQTGDLTFRVTFNVATENALNDFIVQCTKGVALTGEEWDSLTPDQQNDWHYAVGIGAYILTDYVADNYMQFEANPNYYGVDERHPENQLPYIQSVKLVYIAESDQILTQFLAGELDWFGGQKSGLLTDSQIQQLKSTMAEGSYTEYFYSSGSPSGIGLNCSVEPFNDINVRLAMQHAINVEEIWTEYFGEETELVIPGLWSADMGDWALVGNMSDELLEEYTYDPDLAKQLLADAGYPDGFDFEIVCDPLTDMDLYVLVQSYLAQVGINITITPVSEVMEYNAIVTDPSDGRAYNGFAGNFSSTSDVFGMTVTGGFGYGLFHNDASGQEYDDLYQQLTSATDLESAAEYARQMDELYSSQHWCITFGGAPTCSEFMSSRIGGFTGENIYNNNQMHTIFARLWVTDGQ